MKQAGLGRTPELFRERAGLLWREIEPKDLDCDQAIASGLVRAKNGTQRPDTDLMQHPEGAEGWRGRESCRVFSCQVQCSSTKDLGGSKKCNTL